MGLKIQIPTLPNPNNKLYRYFIPSREYILVGMVFIFRFKQEAIDCLYHTYQLILIHV